MRNFKVHYQIIIRDNRKGATAIIQANNIAEARAIAAEQFPNVTMVLEAN